MDEQTRPKTSWELRCEQAERERDEARAAQVRAEAELAGIEDYPLLQQNADLRAEVERLRWWQREVADGMGYLNQAEGQAGYEVAPPVVILAAWRDAGQRIERAELERDEAVALLRDAERWLPSDLSARLDAFLALQLPQPRGTLHV